jgi:hypothetical protein
MKIIHSESAFRQSIKRDRGSSGAIGQIVRSRTMAPRANISQDKNPALEQGLIQKKFCGENYERNHTLFTMRAGSLE